MLKVFEFEEGVNLKVTQEDYKLLRDLSRARFSHIGYANAPLIRLIPQCIKVDSEGYITEIIKSLNPDCDRIICRLVLNQNLHRQNS